jgi:Leucine-rich repeat (LRR) protein
MTKKLLAILLSVVMIFSIMPFAAAEPPRYATVNDALAILRHTVGLPSDAHTETHNFTGTGTLNVNDALLILRGLVGLGERQRLLTAETPTSPNVTTSPTSPTVTTSPTVATTVTTSPTTPATPVTTAPSEPEPLPPEESPFAGRRCNRAHCRTCAHINYNPNRAPCIVRPGMECWCVYCRHSHWVVIENPVIICFRWGVSAPNTQIAELLGIGMGWRSTVTNGLLARLVETGLIPANVTHLNLHNSAVTDLTPLAGLTDLVWLDLEDIMAWQNNTTQRLTDLTPLAGLTNLRRLDIDHNSALTDISPLAGLVNLVELDLNDTIVRDISPLSGMTRLEYLDLRATPVTDFTPLANLTALRELELDTATWWSTPFTGIADLSPLAALTNLEYLEMRNHRGLTDLTPLAGLTNLRELNLASSLNITDVSPLRDLAALEVLQLGGLRQLEDVSALHGLTNLRRLNVVNTGLNVRQIRNLRDALPGTIVSHSFVLRDWCENEGCDLRWDECECDHFTGVACEGCGAVEGFILASRFRRYCRQLTTFTAPTDFTADDYALLPQLTNLMSLTIGNQGVAAGIGHVDFAFLTELPNLSTLRIGHLRLGFDGGALAEIVGGLTQLEVLEMRNARIIDISFVSGLTNLQRLDLQNNNIVRLDGIENTFERLEPLLGLTNLRDLNLSNTGLRSFEPLYSMTHLTRLNVSQNFICVNVLRGVACYVPIIELRAALPDTEVITTSIRPTDRCIFHRNAGV